MHNLLTSGWYEVGDRVNETVWKEVQKQREMYMLVDLLKVQTRIVI